MTNQSPLTSDRRQGIRVRCGGLAKIISLPSQGLFVPGRVLNLSLGGCGIETASSLVPGTRAEIILRVNAASIRALGEVRAPHGSNVVGVEFVSVSAGGKYLLEDLIQQLVREQALAALRKASQHQPDGERLLNIWPTFWDEKRDKTRSIVSLEEAVELSLDPRVVETAGENVAMLVHREVDVFI